MKDLAYYNGEIGPLDAMKIPMNDRGCWFGDGVYDATCADNYTIFALDEHLDRFFNSMAFIGIDPHTGKEEIANLLRSLVHKLDSPTQFVYWQMTRGTADRSHAFPEDAMPNLWVTLRPLTMPDLSQKVKLITVEDERYFFCNIKTLNLLPNVLASEKARRAGAYEAVFHRQGRVTECAHSNVHILKNGVFQTAPLDKLILPGIARAHLIAHCRKLGVPVEEKAFSVAKMLEADEILVSSASTFCASAELIDGFHVGGKAAELLTGIQASLIAEFREATGRRSGT
ncbi:MAG: aminotransferase class IV [Treponema sp.]|jgi:D-alanine transaminase|nr:aminotransferase class IV [Treponema sp.]